MEKIGSVTYAQTTHDVYDNQNQKIRYLITYKPSDDSYIIPKNIYELFKFERNFELFTTLSMAFRKKMKVFQIFILLVLVAAVVAANFLKLQSTITLFLAFVMVIGYSVYMSKSSMKFSREFLENLNDEEKAKILENIKTIKYDDLLRVRNGIVSINHEKHLCETIIYIIHRSSVK